MPSIKAREVQIRLKNLIWFPKRIYKITVKCKISLSEPKKLVHNLFYVIYIYSELLFSVAQGIWKAWLYIMLSQARETQLCPTSGCDVWF